MRHRHVALAPAPANPHAPPALLSPLSTVQPAGVRIWPARTVTAPPHPARGRTPPRLPLPIWIEGRTPRPRVLVVIASLHRRRSASANLRQIQQVIAARSISFFPILRSPSPARSLSLSGSAPAEFPPLGVPFPLPGMGFPGTSSRRIPLFPVPSGGSFVPPRVSSRHRPLAMAPARVGARGRRRAASARSWARSPAQRSSLLAVQPNTGPALWAAR
nr:predicted protein [Triticum aestivum]